MWGRTVIKRTADIPVISFSNIMLSIRNVFQNFLLNKGLYHLLTWRNNPLY